MPQHRMDTTTALATLLSRRAAVLASVLLALASLLLAAWLMPRLHIRVAHAAPQGGWVVTVDWQPTCPASPLVRTPKTPA